MYQISVIEEKVVSPLKCSGAEKKSKLNGCVSQYFLNSYDNVPISSFQLHLAF